MLKQKLEDALKSLKKIPHSMITKQMHASANDLLQELERVHQEEYQAILDYKKRKKRWQHIIDARTMFMDMWMVFRCIYIREAEEEHMLCYCDRAFLNGSVWARIQDVRERMSQLKEFLIKNWDKPYPPFGLMLPKGALTVQMLESTSDSYKGEELELLFGYSSPLSLKMSERVDFGIYLRERATVLESRCWFENKWLRKMVEGSLKFDSLCSLIFRAYKRTTFNQLQNKNWFKMYDIEEAQPDEEDEEKEDWFQEPRERHRDFQVFSEPDHIGPYFRRMKRNYEESESEDALSESDDALSESEDALSESDEE